MLITASLVSDLAREHANHSYAFHWFVGIFASLLFFGSVLFHEMSHSLLARRLGHPVHGITLFVFGGVSEIAEEAHTPSAEFWVAVIGPFSSFFLAAVFFAIHELTLPISDEMAGVFHRLAAINLALGVFNLLPAFPLDGGRVLRSVLWKFSGSLRKATRRAGRVGQYFGYVMIMMGVLIAFGTGNLLNGLWIAFIGWFLTNAAEASIRQVEMQRALEGLTAKDIMISNYSIVAGNLSLLELVENHILPTGNRYFLVEENEVLAGMITIHEVKGIARELWQATSVGDAMKRAEQLKMITPDARIERVLQLMDDEGVNQLPVVEHRRLVGMISRERLLNIIRMHIAFEEENSGQKR